MDIYIYIYSGVQFHIKIYDIMAAAPMKSLMIT